MKNLNFLNLLFLFLSCGRLIENKVNGQNINKLENVIITKKSAFNLKNQINDTNQIVLKYNYPYNEGYLDENNYILIKNWNNVQELYYYGTTDLFEETREGYSPGFFVLKAKDLSLKNDTIKFSLDPKNVTFFSKPISIGILTSFTSNNNMKWEQDIRFDNEIKFEGNDALLHLLDGSIDEAYLQTILVNCRQPEVIKRQKDLKIVFSPIHGTGITLVPQALQMLGFEALTVVEEQAEPNGNFPTVIYPNPEEKEALTLALNKAKAIDADLVIATDPDADRVGAAVKSPDGEWALLNGNQMASLILYYLLKVSDLKGNEFAAKTIVTTDLIDKMCASKGVPCYNTLTGFKYIAQVIRELEGKEKFLGGGEESYGYLIGDAVRDKDAVASCAMIAELTAYAKDQGKSLFDFLAEMYVENNFYYEGLISLTKKGKAGAEEIKQMMINLRSNVPATVAGSKPVRVLDYEGLVSTDLLTGETTPIKVGLGIEASNVIQLILADGSKVSARPSGTEPKIKFYVSVNAPLASAADFFTVYAELQKKVGVIQEDLGLV